MDITFEVVKRLKEHVKQLNPLGDILFVNEILPDKPTVGKYEVRFTVPEPKNGSMIWKTKIAIVDKETKEVERITDTD